MTFPHIARSRRTASALRKEPDHVDGSIPSGHLLGSARRRLAGLWPNQSGAVAKLEAAGYSQIREMTAGKIMTYKAVRAGKEVSLVIDSFGKIKELP